MTCRRTELARLIRPAGYYNVKARRLKNFLDFLANHYGNSMERLAADDLENLRPALLSIKGVGPETADSILLYALDKPTFVVDAYTFRILSRHGLIDEAYPYEELRQLFMEHLPARGAPVPGISRFTGAAGQGVVPSSAPLRAMPGGRLAGGVKSAGWLVRELQYNSAKEEQHGIYRQR